MNERWQLGIGSFFVGASLAWFASLVALNSGWLTPSTIMPQAFEPQRNSAIVAPNTHDCTPVVNGIAPRISVRSVAPDIGTFEWNARISCSSLEIFLAGTWQSDDALGYIGSTAATIIKQIFKDGGVSMISLEPSSATIMLAPDGKWSVVAVHALNALKNTLADIYSTTPDKVDIAMESPPYQPGNFQDKPVHKASSNQARPSNS